MKLTTTGRTKIDEVPYGIYVWRCIDGEVLGDGEGNVMNVFCEKGNQRAIAAITAAARHYGFPAGQAEFWSGKRPIDDEELAHQQFREKMGLVPDELDLGALREEAVRHKYESNS